MEKGSSVDYKVKKSPCGRKPEVRIGVLSMRQYALHVSAAYPRMFY
jgi:hypothetical protein